TLTLILSSLAIRITLSYRELVDVINMHPRDGRLEIADVEHYEAVVVLRAAVAVQLDKVDSQVFQELIVVAVLDTTITASSKSHDILPTQAQNSLALFHPCRLHNICRQRQNVS